MFAPCSLGCPGTPWHQAAFAAGCKAERPYKMTGPALSGIVKQQIRENKRTEQRTLNPLAYRSSCRVPMTIQLTTTCASVLAPWPGW